MVDLRPKTTQGLRTPVLGHESPSPRKKSNNPLSKHVPALSNASSSSQSPPLPIHFLPTPLSTSAAPSITASASAASAAASAAGYSPTTLAPPGHFPPAFKSSYGYSREQGGSGENGYNYGQGDKKGKGKVLGYEGSVPLNDTFEYRQAVLASGRESGEAVSPYAQYGQDGTSYPYPYQYPYASRTGLIPNGQGQGHKRATSDAAGTTFSCPADLEFSARYTLDHSPVDGNGGVFPSHFDKISTPGPNETSGSGARGYEPTDIDSAPDLAPLSGLKGDNGAYTPRSPYRPGEYTRRSARTAAQSDRTRLGLERRLFSGSVSARGRQDEGDDDEQEQEQEQPKRNRGSSPLQPPFEARLILRAGASVDLISWLRKNFHYIPSAAHSVLTPSTSLLAIRALIAERFPRLPEPPELIKAVTVAFPRSQWDYPSNESEPPMIRGLVWNGKELDVYDEVSDEDADGEVDSRAIKTPDKNGKGRKKNGAEAQYWRDHHAQMKNKRNVEAAAAAANAAASSAPITRNAARSSLAAEAHAASRTRLSGSGIKPSSPPPSSFESPSSSSKSKRPGNGNAPATPARSVLDDFAELATLADKTPKSTAMSLPADGGVLNGVTASAPGMQQRTGGQGSMVPPAPAYALANICNSFDGSRVSRAGGFGGAIVASTSRGKKRKSAAAEPDTDTGRRMSRGRANRDASPDRLSDLLAAAQAVDGQTDGPQPTPGFDQAPAPTFMRRESSGSGHKRRRTIGGMGPGMREMLDINHPPPAWAHRPYGGLFGPPLHSRSGQYASRDNASYWPGPTGAAPHSQAGSISPWARQLASLPELATPKKDKSSTGPNGRGKKEDGVHSPPASEVEDAVRSGKDTASVMTLASASQASLAAGTVAPETTIAAGSKASGSSSKGQKKKSSVQATSQSGHGTMPAPSSVPVHSTSTPSSTSLPLPAKPRARKANELPTEGDAPGIDCKPPYPYHEMIRHAIQEAPDCRLQLSQIYSNIADRFPFFKTLDEKKTAGWQNSIRHNLSLKKMFVRVGKMDGLPDEGGKGGWWTVKMGVPDEGRPGRKGKSKRKSDADESESGGNGEQSEAGPAEQALQPMDTGSTRQEAQILETALGGGAGGSAI